MFSFESRAFRPLARTRGDAGDGLAYDFGPGKQYEEKMARIQKKKKCIFIENNIIIQYRLREVEM